MIKKIIDSISKFELDLSGKVILTEAATGNYVVTPVIAALAGAKVYAYTCNSKYGTVDDVKEQTYVLAKSLEVKNRITIISEMGEINFSDIDVVTNTGFLRPIDRQFVNRLNNKCVIPLMWEPWEYRPEELDIEACAEKGIKVYGTNESDSRLGTMDYIGLIALYWLLEKKMSPFSARILIIGSEKFVEPIKQVLSKNNYNFKVCVRNNKPVNLDEFNCIIIAEYDTDKVVIGVESEFIHNSEVSNQLIIHISGNINLTDYSNCIPNTPAKFPYMSFTTDFIDNKAVIDLHTAGFKVAEGMMHANSLNSNKDDYKELMESHYPALAFENQKYW